MFGYAAFAQPPFASLAGTAHSLSLTENVNMADTSSQVYAFAPSITENVTMGDVSSFAGIFIATRNENFGIADSSTQTSKNYGSGFGTTRYDAQIQCW